MQGMHRLFSLEGKVSMITGAARGIGLGMAGALAGAGSELILIDALEKELREASEEILRETGKKPLAISGDLGRMDEIERMVQEARERHPRIDCLINNAGTTVRKPFAEITPEEFDRVIGVNLKAAYFLSQKVARGMIADGKGGKIITVASSTSFLGVKNLSAYGASKGGVHALTKGMAVELAPHGICVNAVATGFFQTNLTQAVWEDPQKQALAVSRIPLGRLGRPEDIAGSVIFLASAASDYITGQVLIVDGGWISA
jgi:NAD(P)-dependent dehydrogenase (short-subunit alcohol dehydrogenase family)